MRGSGRRRWIRNGLVWKHRALGHIVGDVRSTRRVSPEEDLVRIATIFGDVSLQPRNHERQILDPGGPGKLWREPIVDGDTDQPVIDRPYTHVVVERTARRVLGAAAETPTMYENKNRPGAAWRWAWARRRRPGT